MLLFTVVEESEILLEGIRGSKGANGEPVS